MSKVLLKNKLEFRLANADEKNIVFELYESVKGTEFCAWDDSYPVMSDIDNDFSASTLYVLLHDGVIAGALSVVPENELDSFDCWQVSDGNQREIARIVVSPEFRGRGYARLMVEEIVNILSMAACSAIHLSAAEANLPALNNYKRLGFDIRQKAHIYGGEYCLLEKIIED